MRPPIAALWLKDGEVIVMAERWDPVRDDLLDLGGWRDGDRFRFPQESLEDLCGLLDRGGYVWALDWAMAPRTWAQRLFAETPLEIHELLYGVLQGALDGHGAFDQRAVLDSAYGSVRSGQHRPVGWIVDALARSDAAVEFVPLVGEPVRSVLDGPGAIGDHLLSCRQQVGRACEVAVGLRSAGLAIIARVRPESSLVHICHGETWTLRRTQWLPEEIRRSLMPVLETIEGSFLTDG